jgi:hypothetical protein
MKRLLTTGMITAFFFMLSGCIQVSTFISLKPDGTGTVTEKFRMNTAFFRQMDSLTAGIDSASGDRKKAAPFDSSSIKAKAAELGKGVSLLSAREIAEGDFHGYEAVYSFRDISKLHVSQRPDAGDNQPAKDAKPEKKQYLTFGFKKGNPAVLRIIMPQTEKSQSSAGSAGTPSQSQDNGMAAEAVREFFKGMRFSLALGIEGSILQTDAMFRDGSVITLMDIDFDRLMSMPEQFQAFNRLGPNPSDVEMRKIMEKVPGMKVDLQKKVTVSFR